MSNDLHNVRNRVQPTDVFPTIANFYVRLGIVEMVVGLVPDERMRNFSFLGWPILKPVAWSEMKDWEKVAIGTDFIAESTDERLGYLDIDEAKLQGIGKTAKDVADYVERIWVNFSIDIMENTEVKAWLAMFTDLVEIEDGKYEVSAPSKENESSQEREWIYIYVS